MGHNVDLLKLCIKYSENIGGNAYGVVFINNILLEYKIGDDILTSSEMQCTNVLIDYFFKEFVYKNLYVYDGKQKKELCDGLVEFQDAYVIFQIKEKNGSKAQDWLHKKVYRKAVSQIKDTIDMIKNSGEIEVESFSGEKIILVSTKQILPIIIFDSDDADYKQVYVSSQDNALRINVFSMNDFVKMLDSIAIPYDIVYYLELRRSFFDGEFPDVFINHVNDEMTTIARIKDEEGMIDYYKTLTNGNENIDQNAIEGFRFVVKNFQKRLLDGELYSKDEYRETLRYLLKSNRNTVHDFILRWQICIEHCLQKEKTIHHFLIDTSNTVGYLYITGYKLSEDKNFLEFTLRLFKYKFKLATAIGVVFNMIDDVDYTVEWMILASENEYDEYYEQILKEEKPWENGKKLRNY